MFGKIRLVLCLIVGRLGPDGLRDTCRFLWGSIWISKVEDVWGSVVFAFGWTDLKVGDNYVEIVCVVLGFG